MKKGHGWMNPLTIDILQQNWLLPLMIDILVHLPVLLISLKKKFLQPKATFTAALVGFTLFLINPLAWLCLIVFFLTASSLSFVKKSEKKNFKEVFEKGSTRDSGQVIANSIGAIIFSFLYFIFNINFTVLATNNIITAPLFVASISYIAAVNADTFATELGVLSEKPPRLITKPFKIVPKGTSGGITLLGTLASLIGSILIASTFFIWSLLFPTIHDPTTNLLIVFVISVIITLAGLLGSLIDSFLGATIQQMYYCPTCDKETEKKFHTKCQSATTPTRGWKLINNDAVNILAGFGSSLFGIFLVSLLPPLFL